MEALIQPHTRTGPRLFRLLSCRGSDPSSLRGAMFSILIPVRGRAVWGCRFSRSRVGPAGRPGGMGAPVVQGYHWAKSSWTGSSGSPSGGESSKRAQIKEPTETAVSELPVAGVPSSALDLAGHYWAAVCRADRPELPLREMACSRQLAARALYPYFHLRKSGTRSSGSRMCFHDETRPNRSSTTCGGFANSRKPI
jgi:hypothetical protein